MLVVFAVAAVIVVGGRRLILGVGAGSGFGKNYFQG